MRRRARGSSRALINFMLDLHTSEHGYPEVEPPFMVNAASLTGHRQPAEVRGGPVQDRGRWDLYLIPTAEVPLTNLHRGEILDGRALPIRYTRLHALLPQRGRLVRRRRARPDPAASVRQGRAGQVHARPSSRYDELERLTGDAEEVLKRLGLPYRTVLLCTGDMGFASAKTYDIEVWLPSQQTYREISSCSNTEAFQARRANIKFRADGNGKAEFVHTLNGSGLAVGRTLIRDYRELPAEGRVGVIPGALRPFMEGLKKNREPDETSRRDGRVVEWRTVL